MHIACSVYTYEAKTQNTVIKWNRLKKKINNGTDF